MKLDAIRCLRRKLAADTPAWGLWITLQDASITEMAVGLGFDWIVIDAEHGHLDWGDIVGHIRAAVRSETVVLVRIAELNGGLIKRALDIGADGVVVPWIETAEQLQLALEYAKYPLQGRRGIGAERATCWGHSLAEHTEQANDHVLVVPILESVEAAGRIEELSQVDGVEMYFLGPADYSSTAGFRGQWEGPGVAEQLLHIKDVVRRAGRHCGVIATSQQNALEREKQGFRMIGTGMDASLLVRALRSMLAGVGRDRPLQTSLDIRPTASDHSGDGQSATVDSTTIGTLNVRPFRVGMTADFYDATGQPRYTDTGLSILHSEPGIEVLNFPEHRAEISSDQLQGLNGVIVLTPRVTASSLSDSQDLLAVGRFGVGYDSVDVAACTAADVLLFITSGAVDHSVAEATIGWMLALNHHMRTKDRLVREGRWNDRSQYMGSELRGRTLGIIGFGGIGRAVLRMSQGFGMATPLVFDPYAGAAIIEQSGARAVSLDELLAGADFVSLHCPLNEQTKNLISARELSLMKPGAWLINTARGGIVDEDALYQALSSGRLAGAALDCFAVEPVVSPGPLMQLENVLLAPHSIAWTNELFRDIGRAVCQGMVDLFHGRRPRGMVNPEVLERPGFQKKWQRLRSPSEAITPLRTL